MAEPVWTLTLDDSFTHADTSVGSGANSTTGVPTTPATGAANGWIDLQGNKFRINSNKLQVVTTSAFNSLLYRTSSEAVLDAKIVVDWPIGTEPGIVYLRVSPTASSAYGFICNSGGYLIRESPLGTYAGNGTSAWTWGTAYNASHAYQGSCRIWGTGPTNWAITVTDVTAGTTVLDLSGTWAAGPTGSGTVGLDVSFTTTSGYSTRVRGYAGNFAVGQITPVGDSITTTQTAMLLGSTVSGTAPVAVKLYRSLTADYTPPSGTFVATVTGQDPSTTYLNTPGGTAGVPWYYKLQATDSSSTPVVLTSEPIPIATLLGPKSVGFSGDSITNSVDPVTHPANATILPTAWRLLYPTWDLTVSVKAVDGTSSADWVSGSSNLVSAKSQFASAGVTHVCVMLGTNDAATNVLRSASAYLSNMASLVNDLVAAGYKVILNAPPCYNLTGGANASFDGRSYDLQPQYVTQLDALANGTTIYKGDRRSFASMAQYAATYFQDSVHPNTTGLAVLTRLWLEALGPIVGIVNSAGSSGGSSPARIFGGL